MADRSSLHADCGSCAALCCVAPAFVRSAEFARDKPAGVPCVLLAEDLGCSIHDRLPAQGFAGCATYDCLGAGQQVVQHTYGGRDWRASPELADQMFRVFAVMRGLHELLWFLLEARDLGWSASGPADLGAAIEGAITATEELTQAPAERLARLDLDRVRAKYLPLLRLASELARADVPPPRPDHRGADLVGVSLRGARLAGADLRGASLVGADLRGSDLHLADVTGADLRAADVRGTDLGSVLFATQPQLDAARGDHRTTVPAALVAPVRWRAGQSTSNERELDATVPSTSGVRAGGSAGGSAGA